MTRRFGGVSGDQAFGLVYKHDPPNPKALHHISFVKPPPLILDASTKSDKQTNIETSLFIIK